MKLLVLVADYTINNKYIKLMFVHVRNLYYIKQNIDVTVLNFSAKENYVIDNIPIITLKEYKQNRNVEYDILVCHASNIRNHYKFLKIHEEKFNKIVFFFHGHEVLRINSIYPPPYFFQKKSGFFKTIAQDSYDTFKLKLWHNYFLQLKYKSHFVFVSNWIAEEFFKWTKIQPDEIKDKYSMINNSVGKVFEESSYKPEVEKTYDFISIRGNIDGSKYGVDIVNELAKNNPDLTFLIVGRGEFFNHVKKADNVTWMNTSLNHEEMIDLLNQSKCGLLPTRQDTQGVMTCEMAVFGIPVITSDIDVCHEILSDFNNVELIRNEDTTVNLNPILNKLISNVPYKKNNKYFAKNTIEKEIELFRKILATEIK